MLRKSFIAFAAALALQAGGADARGHGTSDSARSTHSPSTRSTSHRTRSSGTRSNSHRTPAHDSRPHHSTQTRRDPAQRRAFMHKHPCPSTGRSHGACPGYVVDHVKALKHGGADRSSNMQWQTVAEAKAKDKWE